jgi:hypothetical protein
VLDLATGQLDLVAVNHSFGSTCSGSTPTQRFTS